MQIQKEESPEFDYLFVALGSFHIELAFFSVCGKIISESGAPHFLNECEVLKKGSLNGFIKGKHYNRCKRFLKGNSGQKKYLQILFLCCPDENPSKMMKFAKNRKSKALLVRKLSTFLFFVMTSFLCKIQRMYTKPI